MVRMNWARAFATSIESMRGADARRNSCSYAGSACSLDTAFGQVSCISMGFTTGSRAWDSKVGDRPSQK